MKVWIGFNEYSIPTSISINEMYLVGHEEEFELTPEETDGLRNLVAARDLIHRQINHMLRDRRYGD